MSTFGVPDGCCWAVSSRRRLLSTHRRLRLLPVPHPLYTVHNSTKRVHTFLCSVCVTHCRLYHLCTYVSVPGLAPRKVAPPATTGSHSVVSSCYTQAEAVFMGVFVGCTSRGAACLKKKAVALHFRATSLGAYTPCTLDRHTPIQPVHNRPPRCHVCTSCVPACTSLPLRPLLTGMSPSTSGGITCHLT